MTAPLLRVRGRRRTALFGSESRPVFRTVALAAVPSLSRGWGGLADTCLLKKEALTGWVGPARLARGPREGVSRSEGTAGENAATGPWERIRRLRVTGGRGKSGRAAENFTRGDGLTFSF